MRGIALKELEDAKAKVNFFLRNEEEPRKTRIALKLVLQELSATHGYVASNEDVLFLTELAPNVHGDPETNRNCMQHYRHYPENPKQARARFLVELDKAVVRNKRDRLFALAGDRGIARKGVLPFGATHDDIIYWRSHARALS